LMLRRCADLMSLAHLSRCSGRSHVVGLGGTAPGDRPLLTPFPAEDEWMILATFIDVMAMLDERVADGLFGVSGARTELRKAVNHVLHEMEAIHFVQHNHVKRRRGGAFLLVAAHVKVLVVSAAIGEP